MLRKFPACTRLKLFLNLFNFHVAKLTETVSETTPASIQFLMDVQWMYRCHVSLTYVNIDMQNILVNIL